MATGRGPVMWQIRRIRLDHIGPAAARFLDVTLDFTDAQGHPLDTILWLRNGGGKSTVLSLVCALIRPHRRDFLATAATGKHLEDYVLGSDTAHVVVEWSGPDGRTLVTGAVYEWADRTQPADPTRDHDRLVSRWYLFTPQPGRAELDLLPFRTEDGRQTPLREFVAAVRAWDAIPHCGAAVTDGMDRWRQMLDAQGLDPEIFTPILQMNATEGGIEGQFQFRTADQFVQYLLELIVDPEVPGAVADILERVRAGLAERPELLADLAFAEEAGPRLRELVAAGAADRAAADALERETAAARSLLAGLAAAATEADAAAEVAAAAVTAHEADATRHAAAEQTEQRAARRWRRVAAQHRHTAAQDAVEAHTRAEQEAAARLAAWRAVPTVHALRAAEQRTRHLELQLAAATEDAEPLRERRDAAARDYAAALDRAVAALDEEIAAAGAEAQAEREAERAARDRAEAARDVRARVAVELETARAALAALDRDLTAAVAAGHLLEGEDAAAALDRHRAADAAAQAELAGLADAQRALAAERQELRERGTALLTERAVVERERAELDARHRKLSTRVAELAADERLRSLSDGELTDPVAEARDLGDALAHAIARAQRRRIELAVDGAEDERALAALSATQLLPGSLDLVHAHDVLEQAGISAVTGWRYLADHVEPQARSAVLRAAPALASGLLVHDPEDLPLAMKVLDEAGLRPLSAIVVGTTAQLAAAAADPAAAAPGFLVPPAPALTDRTAAGAELEARERARAGRSAQDAELLAALERDTELQGRLRELVAACPPGTLDALAAAREAADERLAELAREAADLAEAEDALAVRDAELHAARSAAEEVRRAAAAALGVLGALAERAAEAPREQLAALPAALAAAARDVEEAAAAEARHRALAEAARRHAEALARTQQARRDERAALGAVPDGGSDPDLSVDAARAAWKAADRAYRREVAESALASALEEARHAEARARDQVAALPAGDVTAAVALLDAASGLDPDAQAAATARAADAHDAAVAVAADARAELRAARAELAEVGALDAEDAAVDPGGTDRGGALAAAAAAEHRAAEHRRAGERARTAAAEATAQVTAARQRAAGLRDIAALLTLPDQDVTRGGAPDTEPFAGSLDDARAAVKTAREAWDQAAAASRKARRALEQQGQRLALWAAEDRFSSVKPAVRDRFRTEDPARDLLDDLLPDAERLAGDFDLYAAQLRERLGELEEHKGVVVTAMVGMVRQALKALARAQALSELPDTLGEWAGQRFLEVGPRATVETADAVLRDRCARLVDSLAGRGSPVPRGHELLWQATSAVVGEGNWKARVLKPSTTYAIERVSVERMRKWSGGEKVTISLLLFCTVAKLRAAGRGRDQPGLGVLPLDNPLGKANYVVFLDLQRKVAAANGIQLVFLTGVGDLKAVGRFPNVVRLRNSRSRSREYVSVAERTVAETDPAAAVDVTRLWRENPELTLL